MKKLILLFAVIFLAQNVLAADNYLFLQNEAGQTLCGTPIDKCGFAITYIHSVSLSPVTDFFSLRDGHIWLQKTEYQDFGAGLPHNPEKGQIMKFGKGKISISNFDQKISPFVLRVGRIANHRLVIYELSRQNQCVPAKEIPLAEIAAPGSAIILKAK